MRFRSRGQSGERWRILSVYGHFPGAAEGSNRWIFDESRAERDRVGNGDFFELGVRRAARKVAFPVSWELERKRPCPIGDR